MLDQDTRGPAELLCDLPFEFLEFLRSEGAHARAHRALMRGSSIELPAKQWDVWERTSAQYGRSYRRLVACFPNYIDTMHGLLLPIQNEWERLHAQH
jgi:hypothetical protein